MTEKEKLSKKQRQWEDGWQKGYSDGYKDAIDHLIYILDKGDLKKIYEKVWRKT